MSAGLASTHLLAGQILRKLGILRITGLAALSAEALLLLCYYTPWWQTWDDMALAMLINGYGLAQFPTIHVFYCNFIWAWLVQHLPDFGDVSNYTWAIYCATFLAVSVLWLALAARRGLLLLKFISVSAILFYVFLNPQFTVTALLSALAAVCAFLAFQGNASRAFLGAALGMAFLAFIIRDWALAFMVVLASPLLLWRRIFKNSLLLIFLSLFGLGLACIYGANQHWLREEQTALVITWNGLRQKLTDAHMGKMLAQQPELLKKYGYSKNDIDLLATHFSLSNHLMQNDGLTRMLEESDRAVNRAINLEKAQLALEYLLSYPLWLIWLAAALLLLNRFSVRSAGVGLIFCLIFLVIGYFNRGGVWISRVYYPAAFALVCLVLQAGQTRLLEKHVRLSAAFETSVAGALLVLAILAFSKANLVESWQVDNVNLTGAKQLLQSSVWYGHPVRIEQIFRPFGRMSELKKIEFQSAGWTARLKNSRRYINPEEPDGFDQVFRAGFNIAIGRGHLGYLGNYCREHLAGEFRAERSGVWPDFYQVQCLTQ